MATSQYNQGTYVPRSRPGGGRGRNNDQQPRYRPPNQPQMVPTHGMLATPSPRSQVTMNPTAAGAQRVALMQNPALNPGLFYTHQQQQPSATTASFPRAALPPTALQQFPQGIVLAANPQFQQLYAQAGPYTVPPPTAGAINLQLNQHTPASIAAMQVGQAPVAAQASSLMATAPSFVPGKVQVPPKPQQTVPKRERKGVKIVHPDTGKEIDVNKPTETVPPVTTAQGPLPPRTTAPLAMEFKSKVQSTMNPQSTEFVPAMQPSVEAHRPNAIIRHPDEAKTEAPVVNGVGKSKEVTVDEPQTPLEPPPTDTIEEELKKQPEQVVEDTSQVVEASPEEPAKEVALPEVSTEDKPPVQPTEQTKADIESIEPPVVDTQDTVVETKSTEPTAVDDQKTEQSSEDIQPSEPAAVDTQPSSEVDTVKDSEGSKDIVPAEVESANEQAKNEPEATPTEMTEEVKGQQEPVQPPPAEPLGVVKSEPEPVPEPVTRPPEPLVEDSGPKKYPREFLLSFAKQKACLEPPVGLVKVTDVFQKGGGQSLLKGGPPSFPMGGFDRKSKPKKIIHQPLQTEKVELHKAEERWVRPQDVAAKKTEDEVKTTDLYRKFQGILNKLTPQKFQKLAEQALQLEINTRERLKGCIDKIFTKALEEPSFSIAYANLCKVLSPLKVDWEDEGKVKQTNFRRELLTKCQVEFERDKKDDEEHDAMTKAIEEATSPEDKKRLEEQLEEFVTKARKRSLGNIRFIGELFKLGMLSETIMHECIVRLLRSTSDEESLECFARLITTTGKELDQQKAKQRIDGYFVRIQDIIKKGKIPARIKFMLQDVQELRRNEWVPRQSQASTLKTIDQIHAEAKQAEEEDKRLVAQHQAAMNYQKGRGSLDERRRGSVKEDWATKGEKERAPREKVKIDSRRLAALKKDKKDGPAVLGPPSLGRPSAWSRNAPSTATNTQESKDKKPSRSSSSGSKRGDKAVNNRGSGSGPHRGSSHSTEQAEALEAVAKMTHPQILKPGRSASLPVRAQPAPIPDALDEDTVRRKTANIVDELTGSGDIKEAVECVEEMKSPGLYHVLVSESITHSLEKKVAFRRAAGRLFEKLASDDILSETKFMSGLNDVLEFADDLATDIPKLWVYLAEIISPVFTHSTLPLSCLCTVPQPLVTSGKAAVLVAEVLVQCRQSLTSDDELRSLWEAAKMDWTKLGVNSEDLAEFLTKQSLDLLLPRSSTAQVPPYFKEMAALIANTDNTVNDIFDWVEKSGSVADSQSSEFIFSLATAIVDATVSGCGTSAIYKEDMFGKRATVLQKYVDEDTTLQVQILYALQVAVTKLEHPPKMLSQMFNELYDMECITEAAFRQWKDHGTEQYGKGNCVQATKTFFEWLDNASVESDEEAVGT